MCRAAIQGHGCDCVCQCISNSAYACAQVEEESAERAERKKRLLQEAQRRAGQD